MVVASARIRLYAPWVHSLKEKRMEVKSIIARVRSRFNISAAEVGEQDIHQTIVIGLACVSESAGIADGVLDRVILFIEDNTGAEITDIQRETR